MQMGKGQEAAVDWETKTRIHHCPQKTETQRDRQNQSQCRSQSQKQRQQKS